MLGTFAYAQYNCGVALEWMGLREYGLRSASPRRARGTSSKQNQSINHLKNVPATKRVSFGNVYIAYSLCGLETVWSASKLGGHDVEREWKGRVSIC